MYLEEGALEKHDTDAVVGLLTMTLMAAVFNTQAPISADCLNSSRRIISSSRRILLFISVEFYESRRLI